jgi:hypothetical protein
MLRITTALRVPNCLKSYFSLDDSRLKPVSQVLSIPFRLRFATLLSGDPPPLLTDNRKLGHNKTVRRSRFAVRGWLFAFRGITAL